MAKQVVIFEDLGKMDYRQAWDLQEKLLQDNVQVKSEMRRMADVETGVGNTQHSTCNVQHSGENGAAGANCELSTVNYLLFVEHPPVYTLGKSGHIENILMTAEAMKANQIQFFKTNRGGDITFHGPGQIVGYPILDLEHFYTDIGKYLRNLEEVIILTLAEYGLKGERSAGETGVWIDPAVKGKERKICAIGVRCSRWITMHGFAFNVNTDLSYFDHIIPCGIQDKQVTSLQKETGRRIDCEEVKEKVSKNFEQVFGCLLNKSGVRSRESGVGSQQDNQLTSTPDVLNTALPHQNYPLLPRVHAPLHC